MCVCVHICMCLCAHLFMCVHVCVQQQMQAQHLPHHPHGPPIPLTPHPAGLQPPISAAGASSFLSAFPPGFPGIPPHLAAGLKESSDKGELTASFVTVCSCKGFALFLNYGGDIRDLCHRSMGETFPPHGRKLVSY